MSDYEKNWVSAYYKDLELKVFPEVYDPAEDSLLLADSIEIKPSDEVLEVGCGSGLVTIAACKKGAKRVLGVDINPLAVENTKYNAQMHGCMQVEAKESDLFDNIDNQKFDVIIFNPPYLPEESAGKKLKETMQRTWAGGPTGSETLERFLGAAKEYLKPNGRIYFLISSITNEEKTNKMLEIRGYKFEVIAREKLFFEELIVFKATP